MKGAAPSAIRHCYEFGPYRLDPVRRRLSREGKFIPLYPKAVEALILLVEHPGEILQRETLMEALWPDAIVEDSNLTVAISHLRKVLGRNGNGISEFIQTIPRVGYRFVVTPREIAEEPASRLTERHATSTQPVEIHVGENGHDDESTNGAASAAVETTTPLPAPAIRKVRLSRPKFAIASALLVVLAAAVVLVRNGTRPANLAPIRSVAVLPLKNLTGSAK